MSCNGAVLEVLFKALELYQADHPDFDIEKSAPTSLWTPTEHTLAGPRAQLAMHNINDYGPFKKLPMHQVEQFRTFDSVSTAHAAERLGIGDRVKAADLKPGDVVTFDRAVKVIEPHVKRGILRSSPGRKTSTGTGTTHTVIFLGWIDRSQTPDGQARSFSEAAGFEYFSSQGNLGGKSGMGVNWAYFGGKSGFCPQDKNNSVDLSKDNTFCPDQRHQDAYKARRMQTSADYPWLDDKHGRKSDCCVNRTDAWRTNSAGMKGGRFRSPDRWQMKEKSAILLSEYKELLKKANAIVD